MSHKVSVLFFFTILSLFFPFYLSKAYAKTVHLAGDLSVSTNLSIARNLSVSNNLYITQKMGIGNRRPQAALDISTNASVSNNLSVNNNLYVKNRLGIGNRRPQAALDISTNASVSNNLSVNNNLYVRQKIAIGKRNPSTSLDISGDLSLSSTLSVGAQYGAKMYRNGNSSTAATIDWNKGNNQHIILTGNCTFTFKNGASGRRYTLALRQDGTGSRTANWPGSVRWSGGTAPTLTTTASKTDYIGFVYNDYDSKYDGVGEALNF